MIHTAHILFGLTKEHTAYKGDTHGAHKSFNQIVKDNRLVGISARQYSTHGIARCSVIIDVTRILNTGFIIESDYWRIERYVKMALRIVYGDDTLYESHNLVRIDYRIDKKVQMESERKLYLILFNKTKSSYKRLKKQGSSKFKTSIYHSCKSIETVVYDKNEHCKYQNREPMAWERDMIRFEIRLKNPHIYNQLKGTGEVKCLYSFFKDAVFKAYVQNYLLKIFPTGDFYSFELAEALISSSNHSITIRKRLKHFLAKVSNGNLDTPLIKYFSGWINQDTYNKRLQVFNELEVNPITIPQVYKIEKLPSLLKNLI